jgi:OOP family OmpA-OmpF porin
MRKAMGIGVFVLGVAGLGLWGSAHTAKQIEHRVRAAAQQAVAGSVHGVKVAVSGRDIHLTGIVDGPKEQAKLLAALDAVAGRRVIDADITVLPVAAPFTLDVVKDGGLSARGSVPTEDLRAALGLGDAAAGLVLAAGAPAGWDKLAMAGIAAMAPLGKATLHLSDSTLTLTGTALGPEEAAAARSALAALPAAAVQANITLLDDGTPANFAIDYQAARGAALSGKLPNGIEAADLAQVLGLAALAGTATQGLLGAVQNASDYSALKEWLPKVETLQLTATPTARQVVATVQGDVDAAALQAALMAAGFDATVTVVSPDGANGDRRTNAASGQEQRFMGGYWLAVPQIKPDVPVCQTTADAVLAARTINFVSGSDQLDAGAVAVINDLAAVMAVCAEGAGLRAEIGGHTDSSGDATANLGLSQKRAVAVRRELIARGVPAAALRAVGHGADVPVADNGSEDGRAKNRRTTITWSK